MLDVISTASENHIVLYFGVPVITSSTPHSFEVPEGFSWEGCGKGRYVEFLRKFEEECQKHSLQFALKPICGEKRGV